MMRGEIGTEELLMAFDSMNESMLAGESKEIFGKRTVQPYISRNASAKHIVGGIFPEPGHDTEFVGPAIFRRLLIFFGTAVHTLTLEKTAQLVAVAEGRAVDADCALISLNGGQGSHWGNRFGLGWYLYEGGIDAEALRNLISVQ